MHFIILTSVYSFWNFSGNVLHFFCRIFQDNLASVPYFGQFFTWISWSLFFFKYLMYAQSALTVLLECMLTPRSKSFRSLYTWVECDCCEKWWNEVKAKRNESEVSWPEIPIHLMRKEVRPFILLYWSSCFWILAYVTDHENNYVVCKLIKLPRRKFKKILEWDLTFGNLRYCTKSGGILSL